MGGSHGVHVVHDGLVGHQGQTQDLHAAVLGGNHLGDSRHAHGISADGAKELTLGLRLVARAGHEAVSTVGSNLVVQLKGLSSVQHHVLELHVVSISDGGKSGAKGVVVDTSQRVVTRDSGLIQETKRELHSESQNSLVLCCITYQTKVILNDHDISDLEIRI